MKITRVVWSRSTNYYNTMVEQGLGSPAGFIKNNTFNLIKIISKQRNQSKTNYKKTNKNQNNIVFYITNH